MCLSSCMLLVSLLYFSTPEWSNIQLHATEWCLFCTRTGAYLVKFKMNQFAQLIKGYFHIQKSHPPSLLWDRSKSEPVGVIMWEKHFPPSHFRWNWIQPTTSAGRGWDGETIGHVFPHALKKIIFFGYYPGGFEVLIRQCWLIPAVHNVCYYWMITRDKERERERARRREKGGIATLQCKHKCSKLYIFNMTQYI